ncbi:11129_t:CDS:2 [Racocetra fulgida]|uniref:11129_t:CDS:1 n=1 Tax=Racocetra fulgida TaxID=60492 RepID=A0A9N9DSY8_9GLOM|nr:11129_t:CDS:2 [Racocetra fulgida]
MEILMEKGVVENGVVAQDNTQIRNLWAIREGIPEAGGKAGSVYKYDLSIPVPVFYNIIEDMGNRLKDAGIFGKDKLVTDVVGYGHIGDGLMKADCIGYSKSQKMISMMKQIKQSIDPNGIMNPYKYIL